MNASFRAPYISLTDIHVAADQYRQSVWPEGTIPVDVLKILEWRTPLRLEPRDGLVYEHGTEALLRTDLCGIRVDKDRFVDDRFHNRLRFSISHELGHFNLHTQIYHEVSFSGPLEWIEYMEAIPPDQYQWIEKHADEFAGRFLVPPDELARVFNSTEIQTKLSEAKAFTGGSDGYLREYISAIIGPEYFGVSGTVIEIRLRREDIWP